MFSQILIFDLLVGKVEDKGMDAFWALALAGFGVGVGYGAFGAGGSAFATPVLALLGVPPLVAVASPLPAALPAAAAGAWSYLRRGQFDGRIALFTLAGGLPATVGGALLARHVGGPVLLVLSGLVLVLMGVLMLSPHVAVPSLHQVSPAVILAGAATVGFLSGLLANGGGFLLVPFFLLVLGLGIRRATGTSLVAAAALAVPSLIAHWTVGDIDWRIAGLFAIGLVPGTVVGSRLAPLVRGDRLQRGFGVLLVVFAAWVLASRV